MVTFPVKNLYLYIVLLQKLLNVHDRKVILIKFLETKMLFPKFGAYH